MQVTAAVISWHHVSLGPNAMVVWTLKGSAGKGMTER